MVDAVDGVDAGGHSWVATVRTYRFSPTLVDGVDAGGHSWVIAQTDREINWSDHRRLMSKGANIYGRQKVFLLQGKRAHLLHECRSHHVFRLLSASDKRPKQLDSRRPGIDGFS